MILQKSGEKSTGDGEEQNTDSRHPVEMGETQKKAEKSQEQEVTPRAMSPSL